ncbi:MAG: aspartate carbamoyltransferase [Gemmatimonadota bacterium]|nr:aspartate carbamoyltransferase [Gemmatimonadota bacterium]
MMMKYRIALAMLAAGAVACGPDEQSTLEERHESVAEAGASVMPFDLDETTHVFEIDETGGLQQVVADSNDAEQIRLIRGHLSEEAARFARGDFHDPEMIHGHDMPGLHALVTGQDRLTIEYSEIERGAQIMYSSEDPALVQAIHEWFEAQLADHGEHAQAHR